MFAWGKNSIRDYYLSHKTFANLPDKLEYFNDKPVKIIAGADDKCALLLYDGTVYLYKSSFDGSRPSNESCRVTSLETVNVIDIAAGGGHIFVINDKGLVYGWGMNDTGQLGWKDGADFVNVPKLVKALNSVKVCQVSCGKKHTIMLTQGSMVYTMGDNKHGQLGIGTTMSNQSPTPMLLTTLIGLPIASITAGGWHSFVITISGKVFCWGKNNCGQLGLGTTDNRYMPTLLRLLKSHIVLYVAAGEDHSAALTREGGVFTFGAASGGQLGHGKIGEYLVNPRQVTELMGSVVTQVSCGKQHTLAFVPSTGHIYTCGTYGQLSIEDNPHVDNFPTAVKGPWEKNILNNGTNSLNRNAPNAGLYMQEVFAYGEQSFAIMSSSEMSKSKDFRSMLSHRQVLTLTDDICNKCESELVIPDEFLQILSMVLKSQSCLNGSFLAGDHYKTSNKYSGINIMKAKLQWGKLYNCKSILIKDCILSSLATWIIPRLPSDPQDLEALRLFITLPECHFFRDTEYYFQLLVPFTARLSSLKPNPSLIIDNWHSRLEPSNFLLRVNLCKDCIVYILRKEMHSGEARTKLTSLLLYLQRLNLVNDKVSSNALIPFKKFYIPDLHSLIPLEADYYQWERGPQSAFAFCNFSFVFNAIAKSKLLQYDAKRQMNLAYHQAQGQNFASFLGLQSAFQSPTNEITINRNNLVQDALTEISHLANLKKPLLVKFVGELGQDAGGVRKEFFMLILQEVVDPKYGMFRHYQDSRLIWFADYDLESGQMYNLIGVLCGLAIYNNTIFDLNFPLALYKKLLGVTPDLNDLKELDPSVGRSLQMLLDYDEDEANASIVDTFCLNFTVTKDLFGEITSVPLTADGENIEVTKDNRKEYVSAYVKYIFNESVNVSFQAFSEGFHNVCGGKVLQLFRPEELMEMVVGNTNFNWEELEKSTEYKGEYYRQHPVIDNFWKVFHSFSLDEKKLFLLFLTGCNKVPISGLRMVIQSVKVGDNYLPVSHTCFNLLDLPKFSNRFILEQKLKLAMENATGFHLA